MNWTLNSNSPAGFRRQTILACSAVIRGDGALDAARNSQLVSSLFTDLFPYPTAASTFQTDRISASSHRFNGYSKSLFLAVNGGGLTPLESGSQSGTDPAMCLRQVSTRAWELFAAKAYLHQYTQYGLEMEAFLDSFAVTEQIIHAYAQLTV